MRSKKPNLLLLQGEKSKRAIIEAASRLIATRSYAATSIAAISKASGLPASSIYWHFGSKQGLLAAVIERGALEWERQLPHSDRLVGGKRPDLGERLNNCARAMRRNPQFMRLILLFALERKLEEGALRRLRDLHNKMIGMIAEMLQQALAEEKLDEYASRELAEFILAFMNGYFLMFQIDPARADIEKFFEYLHQAIVGLAPRIKTLSERIAAAIQSETKQQSKSK